MLYILIVLMTIANGNIVTHQEVYQTQAECDAKAQRAEYDFSQKQPSAQIVTTVVCIERPLPIGPTRVNLVLVFKTETALQTQEVILSFGTEESCIAAAVKAQTRLPKKWLNGIGEALTTSPTRHKKIMITFSCL